MKFFRRVVIKIVYTVPALLLFLGRVRIVTLTHPERIGHLCLEPDCYLKEGLLKLRSWHFGIFLVPKNLAANKIVLSLWAEKLMIITSAFWCRILSPLTRFSFLTFSLAPYAVAINETALCATVFSKWNGREPLLKPPPYLFEKGWQALEKLGVPRGSWFVCVHSREGGYSPGDEHLHSYRNSDIEDYRLAIEAIVAQGGWCIRVGEPSSKPLPPIKGAIDYAHSSFKSDWMDVFLCANCLFFLGNSSGLYLLSSIFGIPSALANLMPISNSLPVVPGDIGIPKVLKRRDTGELLDYADILRSPCGDYRFSEQYAKEGILVEENTREDIRDLAIEMLEQCQGRAVYGIEDDVLQRRFQGNFKLGHYSFGATSRIGRNFLRKHNYLLDT